MLAATAALLAVGLVAGRGSYLGGFERTMLTRAPGSASPLAVLGQSWSWAGLVLVLAISGIVISCVSRQGAAQAWLLGFLSAALVIGPLEQAQLHTAATLNQHVGLGAWFAAIAAGYTVDRFIAASPPGRGSRRDLRGVRDRADLPGRTRHHPVPEYFLQLGERDELYLHLHPAGRP